MGSTKEAAFRRKVNLALVTVAVTGLIGAGLKVLMTDLLPKVLTKLSSRPAMNPRRVTP